MNRTRLCSLFLTSVVFFMASAISLSDMVADESIGGAQEEESPTATSTAEQVDPKEESPKKEAEQAPKAATPMTPEQKAAAKAAKADFDQIRNRLAEAITAMRSTYVHFQNDEDRSLDAQNQYRQERDRVRQLMKELYDAADRLLVHQFEQEAVTFIGTSIKHREKNDIYDQSTLNGSTQLIDSGAREVFLFRAASRSAICEGDIDLAERIYKTMSEEHVEDVDKSMTFQFEKIEQQWQEEIASREQDAKKELPRVELKTTRGDFVVELFLDSAPSAVAHFIGLVEDGFYDGMDFYQVIDHLLALTGDPSGDGRGNSGDFLLDEHERDDARHGVRGALVMAKAPLGDTGKFIPNSASSQFAILFMPVTNLSDHQTVFGRVIEGMDVVSSLRRVDPSEKGKEKKVLLPPDRILSAEVIRRPEKLPEPQYVDLQEAFKQAQRQIQHGHSETEAP